MDDMGVNAENFMKLQNEGKLPAGLQFPSGMKEVVVLYITSKGKEFTLDECNRVRSALWSLNIAFIEKDLFGNDNNRIELEQLPNSGRPPTLAINSKHVVNDMTLRKLLREQGSLASLFM